ncbi:MAG: hypothetical protein ABIS03_00070, partial [Gemmatimonadaceae bacterium]
AAAFTVALLACGRSDAGDRASTISTAAGDSIARERQDSINRAQPGYIIDSIRPIEVELERFRNAVGGFPTKRLEGGALSRNALVESFLKSLAAGDSVRLRSVAITAREFADLIYPESPYPEPPYRQPPGLAWAQIQQASGTGLTRILRRLGSHQLAVSGSACTRSEKQGLNTIWSECTIHVAEPGEAPRSRQLFGSIVQRGGQFKFLSFANEF